MKNFLKNLLQVPLLRKDYKWYHYPIRKINSLIYKLKWIIDNDQVIHTKVGKRYQWVDKDVILFHACFRVLEKYVTKELGTENYFADSELYRGYRLHGSNDKEFIDLYLWYKNDYPKLKFMSTEYYTESDAKLMELIKIYRGMWT